MFKSDYGDTIADWIVKITTYISKDKALGPNSVNPFSPYQIYTSFEGYSTSAGLQIPETKASHPFLL
jgi:hypothetical protein